jgi:hypothetical protein
VADLECAHFSLGFCARDSVDILNALQQLGSLAADDRELIFVELDPTSANAALELLPIIFCNRPIHSSSPMGGKATRNRQGLAGRRSLHENGVATDLFCDCAQFMALSMLP